MEKKFQKVNKGIGLITRLRKFVPRDSLVTIYKASFRPHLDYGDIIYDNPGNASFTRKLESIQYNAALAITGCIRGTSREKLYSELGIESLADRRFSRRLCSFYKIVNGQAPQYLQTFIPTRCIASVSLRFRPAICPLYARTERYRNSFFPYCISKWNELDCHIRNLPSIAAFKRAILKFIRPSPSPTFKVINHKGLILLTRLRVGFRSDCHIRNLPSIAAFKRAILKFIRPSPSPTFKVINHKGLILLTRLRVGFRSPTGT